MPLTALPPAPTGAVAGWAAPGWAAPAGALPVSGRLLLGLVAVVAIGGSLLAARWLRHGVPAPSGTLGAIGALCGGGGLAVSAVVGALAADLNGDLQLLPLAVGVCAAGLLQLTTLLRLACAGDRADVLRCLLDGALIAASGYFVLWDLLVEPAHRRYLGHPIAVTMVADCAVIAVPAVVTLLILGTAVVIAARGGETRAVLAPASAAVAGTAGLAVLLVCAARYAGPALVLPAALAYVAALLVVGRLAPWLAALPRPALEMHSPGLLVGMAPVLLAVVAVAVRRLFIGAVDWIGLGTLLALATVVTLRQTATVFQLRRVLALYRHQAQTDPLTGVPNRRRLLAVIDSGSPPSTLLLVDLDGFKSVNDSRGHDVGDQVLIEVARRIRAALPADGLVARLGGDEFAALLACEPEAAVPLAEELRARLEEPYPVAGHGVPGAVVYLSASIGLAGRAERDGLIRMLANADVALRFAKRRGKNRVENYAVADGSWLLRRTRLEQELRGAAGRGELSLVFQPVMTLPAGRTVGVETLLRWSHPELGSVPPDEFIPIAEEIGLVGELDRWVLEHACEQAAQWAAAGHQLWVAVNISVRELQQPGYVRRVLQLLRTHEVPPNLLVLEVTEHAVALDPDEVSLRLTELRELGIRVALDDFGAGYSSLGQLRTLPVDIVKIDRALLVDPLLDISVQLAHRLGKLALAEGIADEESRAAVERTGCPLGQGAALCPPVPADQVTALLTQVQPAPEQRRAQHAGQVDAWREMRQS